MQRNKAIRISRTATALCLLVCGYASDLHAASLYQESGYQALASDRRARRVGDLLTVLVYETSSASSTANTTTGRDSKVGAGIDVGPSTHRASIATSNQLDGRGRTQREGRVLAQITIMVKGVAENGDLFVAGEQSLEINNERQQIKVEGRIRPQDVSEANTILSTRLADAKISYVGEGDLADRQRPSWWNRVLTWFGL